MPALDDNVKIYVSKHFVRGVVRSVRDAHVHKSYLTAGVYSVPTYIWILPEIQDLV